MTELEILNRILVIQDCMPGCSEEEFEAACLEMDRLEYQLRSLEKT